MACAVQSTFSWTTSAIRATTATSPRLTSVTRASIHFCGDRIRIELKLQDRIVQEARFKGDACAISTAAASLLTELILGAELGEVASIPDDRLISALESEIKPARLQCALLPLDALREGLREYSG